MAPGRKDSIIVIRDGIKVKEQRRYLLMTIREVFALYREEYPNDSVKLSTFKTLRPDVVLYKDKMPHNVCVCIYHANVDFLLQGMKSVSSAPTTNIELLQAIACDPNREDCMFGHCENCKEKVSVDCLLTSVDDAVAGEQIKWLQWVRNAEGQPEKTELCGTV